MCRGPRRRNGRDAHRLILVAVIVEHRWRHLALAVQRSRRIPRREAPQAPIRVGIGEIPTVRTRPGHGVGRLAIDAADVQTTIHAVLGGLDHRGQVDQLLDRRLTDTAFAKTGTALPAASDHIIILAIADEGDAPGSGQLLVGGQPLPLLLTGAVRPVAGGQPRAVGVTVPPAGRVRHPQHTVIVPVEVGVLDEWILPVLVLAQQL